MNSGTPVSLSSKTTAVARVPLGSRRLVASTEVSEVRDAVNTLTEDDHSLVPPSTGYVAGTVNGLKLGEVSLVFVSYGTEVTVVSPPAGRRTMLVLPIGPMAVECGAHRWLATAPFALDGRQPTTMKPDGDHGCLVASVDSGTLESLLVATSGRDLAHPILLTTSVQPLRLAAPELMTSSWLGVVRQIDQQPPNRDPMLESGLAGLLMASMLAGLSPYIQDVLEPRMAFGAPEYVTAATAFISRHSAEEIGMEQIARAVGISTRQLHAAFTEHVGVTPTQFLRRTRLENARSALERVRATHGVTISSIASAAGFTHLGRFSDYYSHHYGEPPSETLRRIRSRPGLEAAS